MPGRRGSAPGRARPAGAGTFATVLTVVLGAPASGKTTVARQLRSALPTHVVVDWDDFMRAAGALAGRDVRRAPDLWDAYRQLVRSVIDLLPSVPTVLLGVCTPDELGSRPEARWVLLDCDDDERRRRLAGRSAEDVEGALADARLYRRLHLPAVDTSGRPVDEVARELVQLLVGEGAPRPEKQPTAT